MLSYAGENTEGSRSSSSSSNSRSPAGNGSSKFFVNHNKGSSGGGSGPEFHHLPLSESTLLVWVYRFDRDDPYRPVPNEAALQFAPTTNKSPPTNQALDVEAVGRRIGAGSAEATVGLQGGARDTGLLAWLWGADRGDLGGDSNGGGREGGVRQHFVGSASWQGKPATSAGQGRQGEEDDDIQRAIALSLAVEPQTTDRGVEESKGRL